MYSDVESDIEKLEKKDTRSGFGVGLVEAAQRNHNIVALCADLTGSLKMTEFQDKFPNRFFQVGIAEANMMGIAAGITIGGRIPFTGTFANFSTGRVYDQIRQSIAYSEKNVKICASHAGITLGEDGATHQILEDIALMKALPNMTVINPCDFNQTRAATLSIAEYKGPVYLRFGRPKVPNFTPPDDFITIGKGIVMSEGEDITLIATGHLVIEGIKALDVLAARGHSVELIDIHTIKPLDNACIVKSAKKTNKVMVAEEHQLNGGLGESVARVLAKEHPCAMDFIAVDDSFGESGKPDELMEKYHLTAQYIVEKAELLLKL